MIKSSTAQLASLNRARTEGVTLYRNKTNKTNNDYSIKPVNLHIKKRSYVSVNVKRSQ
jgi:hypothetical protein